MESGGHNWVQQHLLLFILLYENESYALLPSSSSPRTTRVAPPSIWSFHGAQAPHDIPINLYTPFQKYISIMKFSRIKMIKIQKCL